MERNFSLQSSFNVPNTRYIALDSFLVSSPSFSSLLPAIDDEIYRSRNFLIDEAKQRSLSFLLISIPAFLSSKSTKFSAIFGELQWLQNVFVRTLSFHRSISFVRFHAFHFRNIEFLCSYRTYYHTTWNLIHLIKMNL